MPPLCEPLESMPASELAELLRSAQKDAAFLQRQVTELQGRGSELLEEARAARRAEKAARAIIDAAIGGHHARCGADSPQPRRRLIGFCGLAGSGKSSAANTLSVTRGFVSLAFADVMKRMAREIYGFTDLQLWGPSAQRNAPDKRYPRADGFLSPRIALQRMGTELGRECYENTWVDYALRVANALLSVPGCTYDAQRGLAFDRAAPTVRGVAISDVRFPNEVEAIRAAGGAVVRIDRPGAGLDGVAAAHKSETEQASIPDWAFSHILVNARSLTDFDQMVIRTADELFGAP